MRLSSFVATLILLIPTLAHAQQEGVREARVSPGTTWEYGIFAHHRDAAKRWVTADGMIESGKLDEFLRRLGADSTAIPKRYSAEEQFNLAIFDVLGRQGWELVGCQRLEQTRYESLTCHFKRPRER